MKAESASAFYAKLKARIDQFFDCSFTELVSEAEKEFQKPVINWLKDVHKDLLNKKSGESNLYKASIDVLDEKLSSQDILKNIFGGVMIILDRPFQVGDKIQIGDHYGEVLSIGLRSSRIVTPDDSVVSIPNAELMNRAVSNSNTSALDCQVVAEIFLPASVDVQKVKEIAFKAVYASSYTFLNKPVEVIVLNEMHNRQFVVKLRVKAYVLDIRYEFLFKSDMTEMILNECNNLGYIPDNSFEMTGNNS